MEEMPHILRSELGMLRSVRSFCDWEEDFKFGDILFFFFNLGHSDGDFAGSWKISLERGRIGGGWGGGDLTVKSVREAGEPKEGSLVEGGRACSTVEAPRDGPGLGVGAGRGLGRAVGPGTEVTQSEEETKMPGVQVVVTNLPELGAKQRGERED